PHVAPFKRGYVGLVRVFPLGPLKTHPPLRFFCHFNFIKTPSFDLLPQFLSFLSVRTHK
ncbi:hypothetical protein TorRG33x02_114960, partial [Trema orientale]